MTASPARLFHKLEELGIETTRFDHPAIFTVEEAKSLRGTIPGRHIKNLFLKDKRDQLWLIVCDEDREIDLKALPDLIGSARLSFGRPDLLRQVLGVEPGAVTPFALMNDTAHRVKVVLDRDMMNGERVNCHPLVNTATVSIRARDLLAFIDACGHHPQLVSLG